MLVVETVGDISEPESMSWQFPLNINKGEIDLIFDEQLINALAQLSASQHIQQS